jgi:branched-chain amino acid transport system substrate-binding protein
VKPEPVSILAVYPTSGVWETQGVNCIRGAELAVDDVNRGGGLLGGRPLELRIVPAGAEPESAAEAVAGGLGKVGVSAVVGAYLSGHTLAYLSVTESHQVPAITESFLSEITGRGYRHVFKTTPVAADFSRAVFKYLAEVYDRAGMPLPAVAIAAADDASGRQQYLAAVEAALPAGFRVAQATQYAASLDDVGPLVARLGDSGAEALLLNGPLTVLVELVKRLRGAGINVPIVGLGGAGVLSQRFADELGRGVEGIYSTVAWNADISPQTLRVNSRFMSRFGGTFMPVEAGTAYGAIRLAAEAIDRAQSAQGADVATALRVLDLREGAASLWPGGRMAFDSTGLSRHSYPLLVQYQGGVPVTVGPSPSASRTSIL